MPFRCGGENDEMGNECCSYANGAGGGCGTAAEVDGTESGWRNENVAECGFSLLTRPLALDDGFEGDVCRDGPAVGVAMAQRS